jgi:hypothetical protein
MPTIIRAYKLFRLRRDGSIGPLFINARLRIPIGAWLKAEAHPTKGFAFRPGWHCTLTPEAPHLSKKGRVWCEVSIMDATMHRRPSNQGGEWLLANWMRVDRVLNAE